jgi:hypothetical protein
MYIRTVSCHHVSSPLRLTVFITGYFTTTCLTPPCPFGIVAHVFDIVVLLLDTFLYD